VRDVAFPSLRSAPTLKRELVPLFRLGAAGDPTRIGYTAAWTAVTLLVVLRGLTRIRSLRRRGPGVRGRGDPRDPRGAPRG
jgi:hypothetical protein